MPLTNKRYDEESELWLGDDEFGYTHVLPPLETTPEIQQVSYYTSQQSERLYLQAIHTSRWDNVGIWLPIQNDLDNKSPVIYTVPNNQRFDLAFVVAAKDGRRRDTIGMLGLFVQGNFLVMLPFQNEVTYHLYSPLEISPGTEIEVKYRPYNKRDTVAFVLGGFLVSAN
jgi:hypothetical protein